MEYRDYLKKAFDQEPKLKSKIEFNAWLLELGYQIAKLRKERGYSQMALAEYLGVKQSFIARIERGQNMKCSTLWDLAEVLDVDLNIFGAVKSLEIENIQRVYISNNQISNWKEYTVLDQPTSVSVLIGGTVHTTDKNLWEVVVPQSSLIISNNIITNPTFYGSQRSKYST